MDRPFADQSSRLMPLSESQLTKIAARTLLPSQRSSDCWGPDMAFKLARWTLEPAHISCVGDMMSLMLELLFRDASHRMTGLALFGEIAKAPAAREADRLKMAHARHVAIRQQWRHRGKTPADGASPVGRLFHGDP